MFLRARVFAITIAACCAPALAAAEPTTRLVSCDTGSCLLVTGERADAASAVTINGHPVSVRGARKWRTSLPVATVRAWSAPYARTIQVSVDEGNSAETDLPIGLLGHSESLAMLVVRAK